MFKYTLENKIVKKVIFLFFMCMILSLTACFHEPLTYLEKEANLMKNPNLDPLTPEQMVEYIDIFQLDADKSVDQILAGESCTLTATEASSELLSQINYFTNGLHVEEGPAYPTASRYPMNRASDEFVELYLKGYAAKRKYTGYLTLHWSRSNPFLLVELVEQYPAELYWFYKNIPEEILQRIHWKKDGLTLAQYIDFIGKYNIGWDKGFFLEYDGTGSLIIENDPYQNGSIGTLENLERVNKDYFTDPLYYKEKDLLLSYGLSEKNPMTFDWLLSHPKQAYELSLIRGIPFVWGSIPSMFEFRTVTIEELNSLGIPLFPPDDI